MSTQYRLEDVAEQLQVPPTTVVTWVGEAGQSMRWIQGRWYLTREALEALRAHQQRQGGAAVVVPPDLVPRPPAGG